MDTFNAVTTPLESATAEPLCPPVAVQLTRLPEVKWKSCARRGVISAVMPALFSELLIVAAQVLAVSVTPLHTNPRLTPHTGVVAGVAFQQDVALFVAL
jgi:hypothetical protein